MQLKFQNDTNDFIEYNLYEASKDKKNIKKRKKSIITVAICYFILALLLLIIKEKAMSFAMLTIGILWYLFYPIIQRNYYKKHYVNFVTDKYTTLESYETVLNIENDFIHLNSKAGESKITIKEIKKVVELPNIIIVYFQIGNAIVIPKNQMSDLKVVRAKLDSLSLANNFIYTTELNWVWK